MNSLFQRVLILITQINLVCLAFTTVPPLSTTTTTSTSTYSKNVPVVLQAASSGNNHEDRDSIIARNNARTCVKSFLTQRAIQSFMYLLEECRDPHSAKWIEDFLGCNSLLQYHGTGAFNISRFETWQSVFLEMMDRPQEEMIVSAKRRGRGHGGWSKNNPYLEERWVEFTIDVDPVSLAQRIMSVRGQIAQEFVQDLDVLIQANENILESYFDTIKNNNRKEEKDSSSDDNETKKNRPEVLASAFERTSAFVIEGFIELGSASPFRKGNFDLLYNLCTQASIHQVLRELQDAGSEKEVSFGWLRQFYVARVEKFFDGDQPYGRADDFIEEMLLTPPSVKDLGGGMVGLIDPIGTAKKIIEQRTMVAMEWKELMKEIPADHMLLQRLLLNKRMGKTAEDTPATEGGSFQ